MFSRLFTVAYSTNGHHTPRHIDCPSASTDKIGKPPTHQSGSSELVIAQGGGKLRDIKEGTEDHSSKSCSCGSLFMLCYYLC